MIIRDMTIMPAPNGMVYVMPFGNNWGVVEYSNLLDLSNSDPKTLSEWAAIFPGFKIPDSDSSEKVTVYELMQLCCMWDDYQWTWAEFDAVKLPHNTLILFDRAQIQVRGCK